MVNDGRPPGDPDKALWRHITDQVTPLKGRPKAPPQETRTEPESASKAERKAPAGGAGPAKPPAAAPQRRKPPPPELKPGVSPGVDRRTADRLRRGQLPVEAELDLHGLTQADAHRALTAFITGQHAAGRRCVRVITGKGTFREGGGVLRAAVPRWLNEAEMRGRVLAINHAQPRDGGEGALYVLLKRRR